MRRVLSDGLDHGRSGNHRALGKSSHGGSGESRTSGSGSDTETKNGRHGDLVVYFGVEDSKREVEKRKENKYQKRKKKW